MIHFYNTEPWNYAGYTEKSLPINDSGYNSKFNNNSQVTLSSEARSTAIFPVLTQYKIKIAMWLRKSRVVHVVAIATIIIIIIMVMDM